MQKSFPRVVSWLVLILLLAACMQAAPPVEEGELALQSTLVAQIRPNERLTGDAHHYEIAMDGNYLALSVRTYFYEEQPYDSFYGVVYIFERTGKRWQQVARLTNPNGPTTFDSFGWPLAMHGDTLVVGSPSYYQSKEYYPGNEEAFIYRRKGNEWTLEDTVARASSDMFYFGESLSLYGNRLALTARSKTHDYFELYERTRLGWNLVERLTFPLPLPPNYGISNRYVALGAHHLFIGESTDGRILVYDLKQRKWSAKAQEIGRKSVYNQMVVARDTLIVDQRLFQREGNSWSYTFDLPIDFSYHIAARDNLLVFFSSIGFHVYRRQGKTWSQIAMLRDYRISGPTATDGRHVAVLAYTRDGAVVNIYEP
jgi:hypothetical protein